MKFEKHRSAGYLINHLARIFAAHLQEKIRPLGLAVGQFPALLELWEQDGLTQKELVERLDLEQATMANTLSRMERDGLVVRRKHPEDGRSSQVWLTPRARALRPEAESAAKAVNQAQLQTLSASERKQLLALLAKLLVARTDAR